MGVKGRIPGFEGDLDELSRRVTIADEQDDIPAISEQLRTPGMLCYAIDTNRWWRFDASSAETSGVLTPSAGGGRWLPVSAQTGQATLINGKVTVSGVRLTPGARIELTHASLAGVIGQLAAPVGERNVGLGQFVVHSVDTAGLDVADTSVVDWSVNT